MLDSLQQIHRWGLWERFNSPFSLIGKTMNDKWSDADKEEQTLACWIIETICWVVQKWLDYLVEGYLECEHFYFSRISLISVLNSPFSSFRCTVNICIFSVINQSYLHHTKYFILYRFSQQLELRYLAPCCIAVKRREAGASWGNGWLLDDGPDGENKLNWCR